MGRGTHDIEWPRIAKIPTGYLVDTGRRIEPRIRKVIATLEDANKFAASLRADHQDHGRLILSNAERLEYLNARDKLKGLTFQPKLPAIVDWWIEHAGALGKAPNIEESVAQMIQQKRDKAKGERYVHQLEWQLGRFCKQYGKKKPADITSDELQKFIFERKEIATTSRWNLYRALEQWIGFCLRKGWLLKNLLTEDHKPPLAQYDPKILTTVQAEKVIKATPKSMRIFVALGLWCGIRVAELCRMKHNDIRYDTRKKTIFATVWMRSAKTKRTRDVELPLCAQLWIYDMLKTTDDPIFPGKFGSISYRMRSIYKAAGVPHYQNIMRHSFASYHYYVTNNAEATRARLGHDYPDTLFTHYTATVRQATITPLNYFKIVPDQALLLREAKIQGLPAGELINPSPTEACLRFLKLI
jgi:integrase